MPERSAPGQPTPVHAYVALRPAPAKPRPPRLTVENVKDHHAGEDMVDEVVRALEREGLAVTGRSPLGVSVTGPPDLVSRLFSARVAGEKYHPFEGPPGKLARLPALVHYWSEAPLAVPRPLAELVERVDLAPRIVYYADPDAPALAYHHLDVPEDVSRLMDARAAHDHGFTGAGVRVCVVDSGFHPHEWYAARGFSITLLGADNPEDDWYGHGTGITTNAMSVAPGAHFYGVKLGASGTAAFQLARTASPHVISCSWGTLSFDANLHDEIVDAVAHNIVVCFACGNGGPVGWPGSMSEVVSVGGVYADEHGNLHASDYASSGTSPHEPGRQVPDVCGLTGMQPMGIYIAMPTQDGSDCDSTFYAGGASFPDGDETGAADGWLAASGTSSACPAVAGVAALILEANPGLGPGEVKAALGASCRDVTAGVSASGEAAGPGADNATGAGLVDAFVAVHPVDVWLKDSADDNGCVPDTYNWPWTSPDIWVRPADDHGPDAGYEPEHGQANWVYVRVRNRGTQPAAAVAVRLYWADPSLAIAWPGAWRTSGIKVDGAPANLRMVGPVPPGGEVVTPAFEWWPPEPAALGDPGHACLLVRLECAQDPITREGDVTGDNNIAMRNVHVADVLPDMTFTFYVGVGAVKGLEGRATLVVDRSAAPRGVLVGLAPLAPEARPAPPEPVSGREPARKKRSRAAGGVRTIRNVEPKVLVEPLRLVRGTRQRIAVSVRAPRTAKAGDEYVVRVSEKIGETVAGHVTLVARVVDKAPYVGDKATGVYHKWSCPGAAGIRPDKKVLFRTGHGARALKYRPCGKCRS